MSEPLLELRELAVSFATDSGPLRAVDGVSLELAAGEVLALVGESGCGKSVTALTLLGLTRAGGARVAGSARYRGRELVGAGDGELRRLRGAELAMVFQDPLSSLNPVLRVGDQIAEQLRAHERLGRPAARARAVELLGRVGLPEPERRARAFPHQLSGGMRQRATIAMALSCAPSVLVADEPTTALDVTVQAQILDLLRAQRDETGIGILLATHDLGVVAEIADRVAVMHAGRIVEQGPVAAIFERPRHAQTRRLLEARPGLDRAGVAQSARLGAPAARSDRAPLAGAPASPLLELDHVEVEHGARWRLRGGRGAPPMRAVADVTLTVGAGETVGLVGESGCGKTTLARAAVRLTAPTAGTIRFAGRDVGGAGRRAPAPLRGELAMVFQDPLGSLNPRRRVGDSVAQPLLLGGTAAGAARARVAELLERVGLTRDHAGRWPHELSGGQRQRVGIARALASSPRLVVLDEPVSALDVSVQAHVLELLDDLQRELGFAYLFVSHDLGVVRQVSARVAVMYLGKLMEVAPTERVYAAPAHPYTAALLAAVPRRDPRAASAPRRGASGAEAPSGEPPSGAEAPSGCVFHPRSPRATDVCRAVEPPLTAYPDGRVAACHHPLDVTPEDLAAATRSPASPRSAGAAAPSPVS